MSEEHASETAAAVAAAEAAVAHAEAAEAEAQADATETAAEAAVALAHAAAAEAEIQAAETVRDIEEDHAAWKARVDSDLHSLSDNLRVLREADLAVLNETLNAHSEAMEARMVALETHPALTRPSSETATQEAQKNGEASLLGAEAAANLGPAEVAGEASLGEASPKSEGATERRKRRWI